jgi:predicted  nucleic acid-binding Zn-ribbon protein
MRRNEGLHILTDITRLHDMQTIDSYWEKIRRRLLQLQKLLAEPAELVAARKALDETSAALHAWQGKQTDAELAAKGLDQRIAGTDAKMMGGTVRDPKELQALQASADSLRRQRESAEEAGMEALLNVEELSAQRQAQTETLARVEAAWNARRADLLAEEMKLKRQAVQLKGQRARLVDALPAADVALYEDLRKRKAGVAIATITNGQCSACNVSVPTGVANAARNHSDTAYCTSCGRLLFV